jgi:hypothetical protein
MKSLEEMLEPVPQPYKGWAARVVMTPIIGVLAPLAFVADTTLAAWHEAKQEARFYAAEYRECWNEVKN